MQRMIRFELSLDDLFAPFQNWYLSLHENDSMQTPKFQEFSSRNILSIIFIKIRAYTRSDPLNWNILLGL